MDESSSRLYRSRRGQPLDLSEWEIDGSEHVAESGEHGFIARTLLTSLEVLIHRRGWSGVCAASDNYFAWKRGQPAKRVAPDVYLVDHPPEGIPRVWRTWLPGNPPPRWAVEIVSEDWRKDYEQDPGKYEELGCGELVVFDPKAARGASYVSRRAPLTVYRRSAQGQLPQVYSGSGPVYSEQLDIWLIVVREGYEVRLRLSEDEAGTKVVPTWPESAAAAARSAAVAQRAYEAEKAAREAETAARERAEKARDDAEDRLRRLEQALREKAGK